MSDPRARGSAALAAAVLLLAASTSAASERYVRAAVDDAGALRIVTTEGRSIDMPKQQDQVDWDEIALSPDGRSVGWLALYPNNATSYPIPLKLMIYRAGKLRAFTGNDLPVWRWHFTAGGRRIAFEQETVHGRSGVHYELRGVGDGRLIAEYSPNVGPDDQPDPNAKRPEWVVELDAEK